MNGAGVSPAGGDGVVLESQAAWVGLPDSGGGVSRELAQDDVRDQPGGGDECRLRVGRSKSSEPVEAGARSWPVATVLAAGGFKKRIAYG